MPDDICILNTIVSLTIVTQKKMTLLLLILVHENVSNTEFMRFYFCFEYKKDCDQ